MEKRISLWYNWLALYWAEKYINQKTSCDNKLIIVLSDGQPAHAYDECGDDEYSTYGDLKEIYPHLVQCRDLKRLTGQILNIVSKQLS